MKLPDDWVDRIMRRLAATYGRQFWAQWEGVPEADVRAVWARELSGFAFHPNLIRWGLENLPERPPNAIQFRALCRRAPDAPKPELPAPRVDVERVRQALAGLRARMQARPSGREWAAELIARAQRGERVSPAALRAARAVAGESSHAA